MSADNGVCVLVTRGRDDEPEYRVIHAQAIENIEYEPDYPHWEVQDSVFNRKMLLEYFGDAPVLTDRKAAEDWAKRLHDEVIEAIGVVEYGIVWYDGCPNIPFPEPVRQR